MSNATTNLTTTGSVTLTSLAAIPARHGATAHVASIASTDAKNNFADLVERVLTADGPVAITRNGQPKLVMLSLPQYQRLVDAAVDPLASLESEFDALVARMQTPAARAGIDALMGAGPSELGAAAVRAAGYGRP
ncbi:MAG: type II toxin-antitoxin system Phd/YefM family antitoxin [Rhodanobacter sp.]